MAKKILVKTRVGTRLMTPEAFKIAQKFGVEEIKQAPEDLSRGVVIGTPKKLNSAQTPPVITKPPAAPDPLLDSEKKLVELAALRKSLTGKNKGELVAVATEKGYPKAEWEKMNKSDLFTYLVDKHEGANE